MTTPPAGAVTEISSRFGPQLNSCTASTGQRFERDKVTGQL
jgi:hypothetical protein